MCNIRCIFCRNVKETIKKTIRHGKVIGKYLSTYFKYKYSFEVVKVILFNKIMRKFFQSQIGSYENSWRREYCHTNYEY